MCITLLASDFSKPVYQAALAIELNSRGIPYKREQGFWIEYKGVQLNKIYRPDFVCYDQIILELKCQPRLTGLEETQIINDLKVTEERVGLLMNFGALPKLEWRRYVI